MAAFDDATECRALGGGRFAVSLDERWGIGSGRPNGGYLLAVLGRAALAGAAEAGATQQHAVAASVQYATSPRNGDGEVHTEVQRVGRSASQVRAGLVQDGRTSVEASFTLGSLAVGVDPYWGAVPPVDLPPLDECVELPPMRTADAPEVTLRHSITVRYDPRSLGHLDGRSDGTGELRAWFEMKDGRDPDPLSLLLVVDGLPPATHAIVDTGWVPTLALTAYVRAVPAPGPLRVRFAANVISDGLVDEVCEVWDSADRLVAQSTQLAAIRVPAEAP